MSSILTDTYFHDALTERRALLVRARPAVQDAEVANLIARVDAALERLDRGTFGTCTICHGQVETDRLVRDPLAESCAEHPGASEEARLRRDLALAREIQLRLLPRRDLTVRGWTYAYRYEAADEVGGDFCDVIARPAQDETLVLIGDVAGHGVAASMLMSHLLATFRSLAPLDLPTGDLLARVNDLFHDSVPSSSYATMAAAALHPAGVAELYSAGHWTPLLRRGGQAAVTAVVPGLPLGLFPATSYAPTRVHLSPGDALLFFTDGVIDAENADEEDYSVRRLAESLGRTEARELDAVVDRCLGDVRRFQRGRPAGDDVLLFGVGPAQGAALRNRENALL